ncbi:hypothetical protein IAQ61_004345 [Plenodomus lingam]|uniref:uncharacterized protein n=1 Tax=Leptosphaeria maculans TaxID=5022 RepID=UPI00332D841A|nr:hypothetical protein IAQ61_004345 [Plenodomus lingam]
MSVLQPETGIFYGLCWVVIVVRLISRRLHRGSWKLLQWDDYLTLVAMATDSVLIAVMHEITKTSSNLIPPGDDVSQYSALEIQNRIYGSKLVLVVEQMQILTIWLIKTCLLLMYNRMTMVLPQHKVVIATSVYVGLTFVAMEVLYFGVWCRPFNQYWAVPTYSSQCSAATNHLITNAVFNISSDLIIISIPMPLLFKVRLPKKNKAILFMIFLIGAFTIVAAVLNKYYSFTHPFGTQWTIWYIRESYTAILCANLPLTYPLVQRIFKLRNWSDPTNGGNTYSSRMQASRNINASSSGVQRACQLPKGFRDVFKRMESQEDINGVLGKQHGDSREPQFITSVIEMEERRSLPVPNPAPHLSWRSTDEGIRQQDPYHAV